MKRDCWEVECSCLGSISLRLLALPVLLSPNLNALSAIKGLCNCLVHAAVTVFPKAISVCFGPWQPPCLSAASFV